MGKKQNDFIESGRLDFGKNSRFDARLKLNRKQVDARQLLNKKKQHIKNFLDQKPKSESFISKSKKDPLVIVTGLGNVRKDSSGLRVIKRSEHRVVSDGANTVITVRNNQPKREDEYNHDVDLRQNNFQPIKIQIDNNLVHRKRDTSPKEIFIRKSSRNFDDDQMDYENDFKEETRHTSTHSIDLHGNGYKLYVSNLHPKVTEDDVLELFGDIGPIKRARFLDRGLAEVIYLKLEHAKEAIRKYDRNELDGRAMKIELVESSGKYSIKDDLKPRRSEPESEIYRNYDRSPVRTEPKNSISNRFKTVNATKGGETTLFNLPESKKTTEVRTSKVPVDASIIHQVLFNKKAASTSNPVTFTVKL